MYRMRGSRGVIWWHSEDSAPLPRSISCPRLVFRPPVGPFAPPGSGYGERLLGPPVCHALPAPAAELCSPSRRARARAGLVRLATVPAQRRHAAPARFRSRSPPQKRRRAQAPVRMALATPSDIDTTTFALGAAATGAVAFAVFRAAVYFNVQYFIAALLGKHVPRGGARVVDVGIREGRNLYYYPPDIGQVVAVAPKPNVQLLESQAASAKVPLRIAPDFSRIPPNSMDAVVSVYGMAEMSDEEVAGALQEAVRVLKPGKPFVYVENVGSKNVVVRGLQQVIENVGKLAGGSYRNTRDVLPFLQNTEGLEDLQYETILGSQDPHLVGIAVKKVDGTPAPAPARAAAVGIGKERAPRPKKDRGPEKIDFPGL